MSSLPAQPDDLLTDEGRRRLQVAHRALHDAVAAYDRFLGHELAPGEPLVLHDAGEVAAAQRAVETAEQHLWELREELLGWRRPGWAPSASSTVDWFSDEDAIYDDVQPEVSR